MSPCPPTHLGERSDQNARRILLPGYNTLWRLVGSAREHADARGFAMLADTPTSEQRDRLAALIQTPAGLRLSVLGRLRRPAVEPTIGGLINGLARVQGGLTLAVPAKPAVWDSCW